jgi:tRNA-dihydrouridine synthase C
MEGVVDYTLRALLTEVGGIDQCVTEFIRVSDRLLPASVFHRLAPELRQQGRTSSGVDVIVQLLGSDPQALAENAARAVELGAPGIDLNFGCPAKTVNKSRGGAVLLDEPETIHAILVAVRAAVPAGIPVSAKMRLGYRDTSRALENADAIASAGVQSLAVHARTKVEGYRPPAHWEWIARIREAISIPVIANGEVWSVEDYHRCRSVSGCDDVMIGRGLVANPFLALAIKGDGPDAQQAWEAVVPLLIRFHREVMDNLSPRHIHGRLKQWLQMLGWHFPQAQALFMQLRQEKDPQQLLRALCDAQLALSQPRSA